LFFHGLLQEGIYIAPSAWKLVYNGCTLRI
jgi:hypothetical protein